MPYIVIEGMDGCGKSTQVKLLEERLVQKFGKERVLVVREPGSTPVAEELRNILKGKFGPVTVETEILLMAAARAELKVVIEKALAEGKWVISDRNYVSSLAYQGVGHFKIEEVKQVHETLDLILDPDWFILLNVSEEKRQERLGTREALDNIEKRSYEYFKRVCEYYGIFYVPTKRASCQINADATADKVHSDIWEFLNP